MSEYRQPSHKENLHITVRRDDAGAPERNVWLADWKKYGLPYCTLYLISPDNDWPCKVGISAAPRKRVTNLQTALWRPLKVDYSVWCRTREQARELERGIHETLDEDGRWMMGEWFDMKARDAVELVHFKAAVLGVECFETLPDGEIVKDAAGALYHYSQCGLFERLPKNILTA